MACKIATSTCLAWGVRFCGFMQDEKLKRHGVRLGMGLWGATQCWERNERSAIVVGSTTQVGA
eukprot:3948730-Prorocentrum_lima.AAC.1